MMWCSTPCLFVSVDLKRGMRSSGKSPIMQSKALTEGAWMPETDGDWQAILVGIVARSVMSMRRHLAMSMARLLAMKKSAPRMGSVTSATWKLLDEGATIAKEERNVPFSRLDEGDVGGHEGVTRREGLLVGGGGWENGEVGTTVDEVGAT